MAVTKIKTIHKGTKGAKRTFSDTLKYVLNPNKTNNEELVTSYGCDYHTADAEFLVAFNQYESTHGKKNKNDILAYHIIQSFKPGEISPEEANKLGYELASRLLKGKHDFVVSTHVDHLHVHNHIVFCAVRNDCKGKFENKKDSYKEIQRISDQICTEHELSVIINPRRGSKTYTEWLRSQNNRPKLLVDVNRALEEKGTGYRLWAAKHNIQQLAKAYNFMRDNGIKDISELEKIVKENNKRLFELRNEARSLQKRFEDSIELKNHLLNYSRYKEVYTEYIKGGHNNSFYNEHKKEIDSVKEAKAVFREYGEAKLPSIKETKEQIEKLQKEKNEAYILLRDLARDTKDIYNYAQNIKVLLSAPTEQPKEKHKQRTEER